MSADRSAASDGGPMVSRTRRPVGNRVPPSRSQPAFRHVRHNTGDPATARHFTRPSTRDIDRLSSSIQRGCAAIPRPAVWGRSAIALPPAAPWPFCDVSGTPPPAMSIDRRGCHIGREQHRGLARDRPTPFAPHRQSNSDHAGKRWVLGRNRESRSRPGNCDSRPGNAISRELISGYIPIYFILSHL